MKMTFFSTENVEVRFYIKDPVKPHRKTQETEKNPIVKRLKYPLKKEKKLVILFI